MTKALKERFRGIFRVFMVRWVDKAWGEKGIIIAITNWPGGDPNAI